MIGETREVTVMATSLWLLTLHINFIVL